MITTYVGIGSNLQRHQHIEAAVGELRRIGHDLRLSTIYECESVGFDSHAFYNLVVEMKTELSLAELALTLRDIELRWGGTAWRRSFRIARWIWTSSCLGIRFQPPRRCCHGRISTIILL